MNKQTDRELFADGQRVAAQLKGCHSVIVAPDATGENNYHLCDGGPKAHGTHGCGCGHTWTSTGDIKLEEHPT